MKKTYLATLVLVLLTALIGVGAASANGPVYIFPFFEWSYDALTTDTLGIQWGWLASTPGLARIYVNDVYTEYTLIDPHGETVWHMGDSQADGIWSGLVSLVDEDWGLVCPSGRLFGHLWQTEIEPLTLEPGAYTLITVVGLSHPMNDGYHTCTDLDGNPVSDNPSLYPAGVTTYTNMINVTAPP